MDNAFKNFFEGRAAYPTFKKKQNAQSATYASNAFKWDGAQTGKNGCAFRDPPASTSPQEQQA